MDGILLYHSSYDGKYSSLFSMDQTAVVIDNPGKLTVDYRGTRNVDIVQGSSDNSGRCSMFLCASATGAKLKPFELFARVPGAHVADEQGLIAFYEIEEKAPYTRGLDFLREEHRRVFSTMAKQKKIASQGSSMFSQETSPSSSPASTGWDDGDELLLGAPSLEVAKHQNPNKSEEELDNSLSIVRVEIRKYTLLARIHLGKMSSSAFQERVFSKISNY
ncbi:hypothetical protein PHMEG_00018775 [Phytophthora megakarya]|uniref:Uncharacterized protein n=1 Tax=Phytophthora megakarya TaxID=4795 RepID=A0A225VTK7_9STRA|nr:hypothetical protein PHMEG_00018775 [Phytophthora megakarya]